MPKPSLCCLCFGLQKTDSVVSIDSKLNEPYEYVVEKLVIKRVPISKFTADNESTKLYYGKAENTAKLKSSDKSIITFSSYCQMVPPKLNQQIRTNSNDIIKCNKESEDEELIRVMKPESPKEEMTTGRRQQLEQCTAKKWAMAQIHKNGSPTKKCQSSTMTNVSGDANKVLFVKTITRENSPIRVPEKPVDPAVKETIEILANKQMQSHANNRRLVQRDPDTGQIKEIFQNVNIEEPLKLEKIFQEYKTSTNAGKEAPCAQTSSDQKPQPGLKWKIIIKHKNDKEATDPCSAQCLSDSDY